MFKRWAFGCFFLVCCWVSGFIGFVLTLQTSSTVFHHHGGKKMATAKGIVILTGGPDRVQTGFQLFKMGLGERLFISGVHNDVRREHIIPKDLTPLQKTRVDLGFTARSTRDNAAETALWVRNRGISSFYLVTAHYHLPRSLLEYGLALPQSIVYPYAVVSEDFKGGFRDIVSSKGLFLFKEYNKYLVVLARARLDGVARILKKVIP